MKKILFLFLILLCISEAGFAQKRISGIVTDDNGDLMPGVTIVVKNTTVGTITGNDGSYNFEVPANAQIIVYSFIGMTTQEVKINNKSVINVQLQTSLTELDEVVAIGYGTVKKRDLTGAVASVKGEEFEKSQSGNIFNAIQGKLSGVQINAQGGDPASGFNVTIRGASSINAGTQPLYVIDGVQFNINNDEVQTGDDAKSSSNPLAFINPSDIESMEVLKDASATSIFGSRGANGVIIITTKSAKDGKSSLTFDFSTGATILKGSPEVLNAQEFINYKFNVEEDQNYGTDITNDSIPDVPGDVNDPRFAEYNYEDELTRVGFQNNYNVAYMGGTAKTNISSSLGYSNANLIIKNNSYNKLSFNLKADHKFSKIATMGASVNYGNSTRDGVASDGEYNDFAGLFQQIYVKKPVYLVNVNEGDAEDENVGQYVVGQVFNDTKVSKQSRLLANTYFNFDITKGLSLRFEGNANISASSLLQYKSKTGSGYKDNGRGTSIESNSNQYTFRSVLNYSKKIGDHQIKGLAGFESLNYSYYSLKAEAFSFDIDALGANDLSYGQVQSLPVQNVYDNKQQSGFGRLDYNYKSKYYITGNMRVDGSSKFGANNKFGYFPSVAVSWRINEEKFMKSLESVSNFKFRASVGATGNDRIPDYMSLSNISNSGSYYATVGGIPELGVNPTVLGNPELKWETTIQYNGGVDLAFYNNRIQISADFFRKDTKDMLLRARMPAHSGFASQWQNVGSIRNEGWELLLNTVNVETKNFRWTTDINMNSYNSLVLDLGNTEYLETGGASWFQGISRIKKGYALNQIWGYDVERIFQVDDFTWQNESDATIPHADRVYVRKEGIPVQLVANPQPGNLYFSDISGPEGKPDGLVNSQYDKTYIGDATPDLFGGINNTMKYKNFDFSFFFKYSVGGEIFYGLEYYLTTRPVFNRSKDFVENMWTIDNPSTKYTSYAANNGDESSSHYVHDGSYIKLQNVTLGYTLPGKFVRKLKMNSARVYATGSNLFTLTNYPGINPDVQDKGLFTGYDRSTFPVPFEVFAGIKITL